MPTLTTFRRTAAPLLGTFEYGTADAASTTSRLVCTTTSQNGFPFRSSTASSGLFKDKWLYRPEAVLPADQSRSIATYTPTSGYLDPDDDWTNAPDGEEFEVLGLFSGPELNGLVNLALKDLWVVVDVTFTVANSQYRRHSLATAAPWLTNPAWVYQVGQLQTGLDPLIYDPYAVTRRGKAVQTNGVVYLEGPTFPTSDTVYVKAIAPAYAYCRASGGTFGEQSGLVLETDEAIVDETWLAWRTVVKAEERLRQFEKTGQADAKAMQSLSMAAAKFSDQTRQRYQEPRRTFIELSYIGSGHPRRGRAGGVRW
jgi:hypothetical protein